MKLWRAEDRTPRAQVIVALPTSTVTLPIAPEITSPLRYDLATGEWTLDVDIAEATAMVRDARDVSFVGEESLPAVAEATPSEIMQAVVSELIERGYSEEAARRMAGYRGPLDAIAYGER